ncbi:hypothetical protein SynMITS9220_01746 [Synechococcus sp. MIT S9220]|nr:hypothetical protein SynMITS9220_01746 [Synechococcus sp. MIT S9220]
MLKGLAGVAQGMSYRDLEPEVPVVAVVSAVEADDLPLFMYTVDDVLLACL